MVKKAYMKTIEILLVIVLTTMFLLVIMPKQNSNEDAQKSYLIYLEPNNEFRSFASNNIGCYNSTQQNVATRIIYGYIPIEYDYIVCIDDKTSAPDKDRIYVETMLIAGNYSSIDVKEIRLYYWLE